MEDLAAYFVNNTIRRMAEELARIRAERDHTNLGEKKEPRQRFLSWNELHRQTTWPM